MIKGYFSGDKVVSSSAGAFSLYEKSRFGEKKANKIEYAAVEVLYLFAEKKMEIVLGKKIFDWDGLLRKFKKHDKKIEIKSAVFSDLRKKGYLVKSALKFGAEFRVYDKGARMSEEHARWILYCVREHEQLSWHDFTARGRVAHSTKKNLLLGIVDDEGEVIYYEVGWVRA
ncbi:MAG: tRNA-intron lyase [Nanoarchaeota archaeon]|nr:tRNA-intron lyase [Nanoarchaeota archaeon]MBU1103312.1 tRNA-intron lyase [Nanoarchaeota archaeon]